MPRRKVTAYLRCVRGSALPSVAVLVAVPTVAAVLGDVIGPTIGGAHAFHDDQVYCKAYRIELHACKHPRCEPP